MFPRLRIFRKSGCLKDSDRCVTECGKSRKKNKTFAASAALSLCAAVVVLFTSLGNGILAQTVGSDSVTNDFDILIGKYFTITFQYYLWDDHDNCVRFYNDYEIKVKAKGKDEDGNAYAIYQFPTNFTNEIYLQETDEAYYKFASFWGPDDEKATVDKTNGNIVGRRWERIWNPELNKDNSADGSTNLSKDSKITIKGDMIYEVNYYPKKYSVTYDLGWDEEETQITSVHGSNDPNNPGDYTVIYKEEIKPPTRLGYTFLGWTKSNGESAAPVTPLYINPNAELDAGKAAGDNVESDTFFYIPYLDDKYKGVNGEHYIGKLTPDYEKIMALYDDLNGNEKGDVTLTAQWEMNQYNITYDVGGGSLTDKNGNALSYTYDAASNTFKDASGSTVDVNGAPTMYNVELGDENGNPLPGVTGGSVEERKLTIDVKATPPADSNSTFAGWQYYDAQGLSQVSTPIVISHGTVGNFELEAVFISSEAASSRIIYENVPQEWLEGTGALPESYSTSGTSTVVPVKSATREVQTGTDEEGNPITKTYTFTGWTCSNEYSVAPVRVKGDLTVPTTTQGDIILVAHWQETTEDAYCTVNYYAQKKPHIGFIPEYKVKAGETITLVENQYTLDKEIYPNTTFDGWYMYTTVGEHIEKYKPGDTVTITGDTAFHAVWKTKVTFQPYADETPETLELEYDKPVSEYKDKLPAFTKTGYKQIGWNTTVDGAMSGETVDLTAVTVEDGLTLYAVWKEWKYPITFSDSDGTNTQTISLDVESVDGGMVTLPEFSETGLTTQEGCLFGGWLDESESKVYQPGDKLALRGEEGFTLKAYWINRTQTVTVQDGNNGISDTSIEVMLNEDGTYTFNLDELKKAAGFSERGGFAVYIGNSYGSSLSIGTVQSGTDVAFSMNQTYTLDGLEIKLTDYGAYLFIKSWW